MAKIGYIFASPHCDTLEADRRWMAEYGCVRIVEEQPYDEVERPQWNGLIQLLQRGDELVLSKFSNALRGSRQLSLFIELCRVRVVRIISINDRIDSAGILFPETTAADVLAMVGSLPEEAVAMRRSAAHLKVLSSGKLTASKGKYASIEREQKIVSMYNDGISIDTIWRRSGFRSRSSVFRILNKHNIPLTRGRTSGPLGPRPKKPEESQ